MAEPRVQIFMDYQNVHLSVAEAFAPVGTPPSATTLHPGLFGDAVMNARMRSQRTGVLTTVHVFRGQASSDREPTLASITKAQAANWCRDRRVTMHTRPLRYPHRWPDVPAREKGVDVMLAVHFVRAAIESQADTLILASRDTDLLPALEMAVEFGKAQVETCMWENCSRLRLPKHQLWSTYLTGADYLASKDKRQY
jgi:NYN domain